MICLIPSLIQLVFSLSLLSFPVECQEVFTLTVSPEQSMAGLCPERITFNCTTRDVNNLGTAIRWYFNNDPGTVQNEFVYTRDQTYPLTVQGRFAVVVESADLNSDSSSVNAVVTLPINASTLVAMGITSVQCGRTLTTRIREVNISSQLDDMESPSLSQLNLNATYTDSGLWRVDVSSQQFYNLSNCDYKENTAINVTSQVGDTVCNVTSASSASCEYPMRPNSIDITVQITATNSLGLSSFRNYTIPTISFINMSIAFNDSLCNIRIECLNVSSQSRLDRCELFNTNSSYDDMMLIPNAVFGVDGGKTYFFRAIYKDEVTTILQRNFTTESCANMNGPKEEKLSVGAIVGIAIAAVVIAAVIVIVIGLLIFLVVKGPKRKRKYTGSDDSVPTATYNPLRDQVKTSESPQKGVDPSEETNKSARGDVDPLEETIEVQNTDDNNEDFAETEEQLRGGHEHKKKLQENVDPPAIES